MASSEIGLRLTLIGDSGERTKAGHRVLLFRCDCGNLVKSVMWYVAHGKVKSCGCFSREMTMQRASHGHARPRGSAV